MDIIKEQLREEVTADLRERMRAEMMEELRLQRLAMQQEMRAELMSMGLSQQTLAPDTVQPPKVSTKGSCPGPSGDGTTHIGSTSPCELYVDDTPPRLVALGKVFEGATTLHSAPLQPMHVKVTVDEVREPDAAVPVPTSEVRTVAQALQTFVAWPQHLVQPMVI